MKHTNSFRWRKTFFTPAVAISCIFEKNVESYVFHLWIYYVFYIQQKKQEKEKSDKNVRHNEIWKKSEAI